MRTINLMDDTRDIVKRRQDKANKITNYKIIPIAILYFFTLVGSILSMYYGLYIFIISLELTEVFVQLIVALVGHLVIIDIAKHFIKPYLDYKILKIGTGPNII